MSDKKTENTTPTEEIKDLNYFEELAAVNVNGKTEEKNGLKYLSWAFAWGELKKRHPTAFYTIYENAQGWNYHTDGRTAWVKTGVTVDGIEHIEYLPVMDYKNQSIPLDKVTSIAVNKTIQRSLTKAVARHGLGLYVYAGEDLPEAPEGSQGANKATPEADVRRVKDDGKGAPVEFPEYDDPRVIFADLKNVIAKNGLNGNDIAAKFNLSKTSTAADLKAALDYARGLVR